MHVLVITTFYFRKLNIYLYLHDLYDIHFAHCEVSPIPVHWCSLPIYHMRLVHLETGGFDEKMLTMLTVV